MIQVTMSHVTPRRALCAFTGSIALIALWGVPVMVFGEDQVHKVPTPEAQIPALSGAIVPGTPMRELKPGEDLTPGTYETVSTNGSITRALCPYTCDMRGLPKEHCKTWASKQEPSKCYVQDTRLQSNAIPEMGTE